MRALPRGEGAFNEIFRRYVNRAKKVRRPFELTRDEFRAFTKQNCHYCDCPPMQEHLRKNVRGYRVYTGPYIYNGVDRLNSKLGYTKDNCVACCGRCNKMKLDMTVEQFVTACREIVNHMEKTQ
jgi:hypothetical protein